MGRSRFKAFTHKKNIKSFFRATCIWSFNPKAMIYKIWPWEMHTIANINDQGTKDDDTIVEEIDHNQDWGEESIATKKLDIIEIVQQMTIKDLCTNR